MSGVRRGRGWPTGLLASIVGGLVTVWPVGSAGAQDVTDPGPAGRISGVILEASGGAPLAGATVTLEPLPQGIVTSPEGGGGGFLEAMRITESDERGRYSFDGLPEATYRLRVARLGYRSATMHVEYRGSRESRVSVGLEVEPIQLDPVEVVLDPVIPMTHTPTNETVLGAERIQVELARQAMFTQSDVRSLTRQDLVEAVTLGETDLFRALHRMPGVTVDPGSPVGRNPGLLRRPAAVQPPPCRGRPDRCESRRRGRGDVPPGGATGGRRRRICRGSRYGEPAGRRHHPGFGHGPGLHGERSLHGAEPLRPG